MFTTTSPAMAAFTRCGFQSFHTILLTLSPYPI
jgi:hypothetical protein